MAKGTAVPNSKLTETKHHPVPEHRTMKLVVTQPFSVRGVEYQEGEVVLQATLALDPAVADRIDTGFLRVVVE